MALSDRRRDEFARILLNSNPSERREAIANHLKWLRIGVRIGAALTFASQEKRDAMHGRFLERQIELEEMNERATEYRLSTGEDQPS